MVRVCGLGRAGWGSMCVNLGDGGNLGLVGCMGGVGARIYGGG